MDRFNRDWLIVAAVALGLSKPTTVTTGGGGDHQPPPSGNLVAISLRLVGFSTGSNGVLVTLASHSLYDLSLTVHAVTYNSRNQVIDLQDGSVFLPATRTTSTSFDYSSLSPGTYRVNVFAESEGKGLSNSPSINLMVQGSRAPPPPLPPPSGPAFYQSATVTKGAERMILKVQLTPPGNVDSFVSNWERQGYAVSLGGYFDAQGNPTSGP